MQELLVLDSRVDDIGMLVALRRPGMAVLLLQPHEDGVAQIVRALAGRRGLAALHIVSHGSDASLQLGQGALAARNLDTYAAELASIGASLVDGGALLLYGCEVAATARGQGFASTISRLTGAHVAAATGKTAIRYWAAIGPWPGAPGGGRRGVPRPGGAGRLQACIAGTEHAGSLLPGRFQRFRLDGVSSSYTGASVSSAGDVNGDGFDDLVVGANLLSPNGVFSGASYVVFGKEAGFAALASLTMLDGSNGFRLAGAAARDYAGISVSGAGDVNGDGFADLIVGAPGAAGLNSAGASYVVFGHAGGFTPNIELSSLNGSNGFRLNGVAAGDGVGASVSGAGDLNGDGFADLVIGAFLADSNGLSNNGAAWVVFGQASGFASSLSLSALDGRNGLRLSGVNALDLAGNSVAQAGDVNGDGFDDLIVGANGVDIAGGFNGGAGYVMFGRASGFAAISSLAGLDGVNGFKLVGASPNDHVGNSVRAAGDVNGDGFADLIVGAYGADPNGLGNSGASYVVFGHAGGLAPASTCRRLTVSTASGFPGSPAGDYSGTSVSGAGDLNGDGFDDLIVGATGADPHGARSGESYVVFGRASGFASNLNLSALPATPAFALPALPRATIPASRSAAPATSTATASTT